MELVSLNSAQQLKKLPPLNNNLPGQVNKSKEDNIGGKYILANNSIAHTVPPRNLLKGTIDQTGVIDSWPAHNSRPSNMQLALNKNNNLIISNLIAEGKPDITPKPRFLENLEKFLQRELKALGCSDQNIASSETRLQAFREAFEYLLEEFKTYKPLLSSIKNEYEMMLAAQNQKIRELEPLKQMLVTLADQCDYKLMQFREEEKLEVKELKEEKKSLMELVLQLKNEKHSLRTQVDKLQSELSVEHEKFRNEQDKKKLLIMDLNDLRFQQEEAKLAELKREKKRMAEGAATQEENSQDDPVTLKIALRVCRQNLNDAMKRLTKLEADYGDVIPRREFLEIENKYNKLLIDHDALDKDSSKMKQDYHTLKENFKILEDKHHAVSQELDHVKSNSTPRPDWDRCTMIVNEEKWTHLANNKTSIQLLDTLLNEIQGKKHSSAASDFNMGLGIDQSTPAHLRYDGKIKHIKMKKADLINLIGDIWREREKGSNRSMEMSEFLIKYLKKRYPSEQSAFEHSYLLSDVFETQNNQNEYITQFTAILNGKLDEEIYFTEQKAFKRIFEQLQKESEKEESEDDTVSKNTLRDVLKSSFKYAKNEMIDMLIRTAEDELDSADSSRVEYKFLFNEETKAGNFMNSLRGSFKEDRLSLANKIRENIGHKGPLTSADLRKSINTVDSSINDKELENIINWCFKNNEKSIEMDNFNSKIESCSFN